MVFGRRMKFFVGPALSLLVAACGGGGSAPSGSASFDPASQKQ